MGIENKFCGLRVFELLGFVEKEEGMNNRYKPRVKRKKPDRGRKLFSVLRDKVVIPEGFNQRQRGAWIQIQIEKSYERPDNRKIYKLAKSITIQEAMKWKI